MKRNLLGILCCPKCRGNLTGPQPGEAEISEGDLFCDDCGSCYPVINGIPRFVEADNYASSFGYQWNLFRKEQMDSQNGATISADRLWNETGWTPEELKDKWVLDVGCGAGRFLDASSMSEGKVVGIDISSAIDAAKENLKGRENVHLIQASIYDLPFKPGIFDYVYCIGVIQHTPNPVASIKSIAEVVKPEGELAVTIYPRKLWTKLFSKYWIRPVTKRLKKETLLKLIQIVMPVAFPVTDLLFRIPFLGKGFMFLIPVANYVHEKQLNKNLRYETTILDTFDMLSPAFDQPMTEEEARQPLSESGFDVTRNTLYGLNLVGKRRSR